MEDGLDLSRSELRRGLAGFSAATAASLAEDDLSWRREPIHCGTVRLSEVERQPRARRKWLRSTRAATVMSLVVSFSCILAGCGGIGATAELGRLHGIAKSCAKTPV